MRTLRILGWPIAIAVSGYFVWFLFKAIGNQDFSALATVPTITAMCLATLLYTTIIPISAWAWALLLGRQGEKWAPRRLAAIMGATQAAKYIPGNVAQHIGRASLVLGRGMRTHAFAVTIVQEMLLAVTASIIVGSLLLWVSPEGFLLLPEQYRNVLLLVACGAAIFVIILAIGPENAFPVMTKSPKVVRIRESLGRPIGFKVTGSVLAAYCANYLLIGAGMWGVAYSLGIVGGGYALLTAAFTLAWLLGFLTPGAPAGMGVREGVLALILGGVMSDMQLLSLIVAMRVVTLIGDGVCFIGGVYGLRKSEWVSK